MQQKDLEKDYWRYWIIVINYRIKYEIRMYWLVRFFKQMLYYLGIYLSILT